MSSSFNYSWRNWTYGERKQRSEEPEEPAWDPWEEFNNSYGGTARARANGNGRARNFASASRAGQQCGSISIMRSSVFQSLRRWTK